MTRDSLARTRATTAVAVLLALLSAVRCVSDPTPSDAGMRGDAEVPADPGVDGGACAAPPPACCDSCLGDAASSAQCADGKWQCASGYVTQAQCAAVQQQTRTPFCSGPGLPTSQDLYSYPGCEDAGSYGCPNMLVFWCAMRTIESKYNQCSSPSDCVPAFVRNCVGALSGCPPAAVNDAGLGAFWSEAQSEVWRYCGDGGATCVSSASCAYSYSTERATCVNGRCVPLLVDGGQP